MSNYTITTNFGAKDSLPSGNAGKVIKGSEFTTEFTNIQTAVATKANTVSPTFTGEVTFDAAVTVNSMATITGDLTVDTNTLFVDVSENKVGIGTSSPDYALDVDGTIASRDAYLITANSSGTPSAGAFMFRPASNILALGTNSTERMRIDSTGNVGIGTDSPAYNLDIEADTAQARIHSTVGNSVLRLDSVDDGESKIFFADNSASAIGTIEYHHDSNYMSFDTVATERMRIDSSGNVGIGTDSPAYNLVVNDTASSVIQIRSGNDDAGHLYFADTDDDNIGSVSYSHEYNFMGFKTNDTERLRIDSLGNVGIGTDSPTGDLTIGRNGNASGGNIMLGSATNNTNKYGVITSKAYNSSTDTEGFAAIATQGTSGTNLVTIGGGIGEVDSATQVRLYTSSASGTRTGTERMRIDSTGNVGIGTTTVGQFASTNVGLTVDSGNDYSGIAITDGSTTSTLAQGFSTTYLYNQANGSMLFGTNNTERMRIDSSGNLLVGKTDTSSTVIGCQLLPAGGIYSVRDDNLSAVFDRKTSDGGIVDLRKDGTTVGSIGAAAGNAFVAGTNKGFTFGTVNIYPCNQSGTKQDANTDLGHGNHRFRDIFRSGSTYSTSDRNKKQDIRDLTDAEARVAVVAKGSLKAFRYIDNVEAEGDDANIHFGIIAQDLKAAFEAEGLNADNYQVLKTSTYTDDDGVGQTTYSVCYENLLAFIISAI